MAQGACCFVATSLKGRGSGSASGRTGRHGATDSRRMPCAATKPASGGARQFSGGYLTGCFSHSSFIRSAVSPAHDGATGRLLI